MSSGTAGRLTSVDALRGLAALGVLCCHVPHPLPEAGHGSGWLFLPATVGVHGVTLFLVISGLCIHLGAARALARGEGARCHWRAFWARRFRRLYPPYLAAVLFTLLAALALFPDYPGLWAAYQSGEVSPALDVLTHLLMAHNLFARYAGGLGNGPFWTLGLEEQLYALYAVLLLLRSRLPAGRTFAVTAAVTLLWCSAGVVLGIVLRRPWVCWYTWPFGYWLLWGLGALAAEAHTGALALPRWCHNGRVAVGLLTGGVLLLPPGPNLPPVAGALLGRGGWLGPVGAWHPPLHLLSGWLVGVACFVLLNRWLRFEAGGRFVGPSLRRLAAVGVMSYSLYLTHVPVLRLCDVGFTAARAGVSIVWVLARYAVCVPACLGVAWAFFRLVERHFLNTRPAAEGGKAAPRLAA
ncbi:MAG TPA: acyltransferase [Gemmataceae bacterium]|nr:acyltransferase [Gemmataceae bacterium]